MIFRSPFFQDVEPDDVPYPLTKEEALSFLENVLKIPNPEELIERDPMAFLNTYIYNMITKLPFTNLPHVSQPMNDKHNPTFEECKMAILRREGGHCFYKNTFSKALLDLMGYDTFHVGGNNVGEDQFDTHCGIVVCNLTFPGSLHLAEPGTRRPLYQAIPLDFKTESQVYKFHFMRSKFFKREHGILLWCAEAADETAPSEHVLESEGTFWKVQLIYRLNTRRDRAFYLEKGGYRFGIPGLVPTIHQTAFLVGYEGNRILSIVYQRNLAAMGCLAAMRIEYEDPAKNEFQLLTDKEVLEAILLHFPQYSKQLVQRAIDNVNYGGNLYCL